MSPSVLCPNCQKSNLVRCKILRQTDPDYGREYEACSNCPSKWFTDDPDRPKADPLEEFMRKKKKSIWERLGNWGAPTLPEGLQHHPATYIFPPAHEYPQIVFPISPESLRPSFTNDRPSPSLNSPRPAAPAPAPAPPPPAASVVRSVAPSPVPAPAPPPPPPAASVVRSAAPSPLPSPAPCLPDNPTPPSPSPPPPPPEPQAPTPVPEPALETKLASEVDAEEERARYEMLMKIANSPAPPLSLHHDDDHDDRLYWQEASRPPPTPVSHRCLSPHLPTPPPDRTPTPAPPQPLDWVDEAEEALRAKLFKIVATPLPPTPLSYHPSQATSPVMSKKDDLIEDDVASYTEKISQRLDDAIAKSPFLKSGLESPAPVIPTPRSVHYADEVEEEDQDEVPLPGSFANSPRYSQVTIQSTPHSHLPLPPLHFEGGSVSGSLRREKGKEREWSRPASVRSHRTSSPLFT